MTHVDNMLPKFKNLQILSLPGNNIQEIDGSKLPRTLKFLELCDNFIHDVRKFVNNPPRTLLHIGLRRNCLDDGKCYIQN